MAAKPRDPHSISADRGRFLGLGLGCLPFTLAGLWLVVAAPQGTSSRVWGAISVLFFGSGLVWTLRSALKGQAWPERASARSPLRQMIVPVVLLFTLPWPLKLWFCLPLIAAWALLWPIRGERRWLVVAWIAAAVIAAGQGVAFAIALLGVALEETPVAAILPLVFLALVLWLDVRVVLDVRRRLAARPRP